MVKKSYFLYLYLFLIFSIVTFSVSAGTAFNFTGYTKYINNTNMTNVNVSIEITQMSDNGPPTSIGTVTNLSNANGAFILTINSTYANDSYSYKPVIIRYNGTSGNGSYAQYIGQSLPNFDYSEFVELESTPITFYLKEAITVDLSAIGLSHATGSLSDINNVTFSTDYKAGLELVNLSGYGNGEYWAYMNNSDCLFVLNSTYAVNMSFCSLNITNVTDIEFTRALENQVRFYLLNQTQVELCILNGSDLNCTTSYNITSNDFAVTSGIAYSGANSLFYISGRNSTGTHWVHKYNVTFNLESYMDRPDYADGKLLYLNNYLYTVANKTGTGWIIYRCSIGAGDVCEDYSTFKVSELNISGIAYNASNQAWYYSSYTNNSIVKVTTPFTENFNFFYQVKDLALGYPVKETFSLGGTGAASATFYVPADKNYSMMIYPNNGPAFPAKLDLNNLVAGVNISTGSRNATITALSGGGLYVNLSQINMTTQFVQLSGYVKWNTSAVNQDFTNYTIVAYLIEGGNMIFKGANLPSNMGNWQYPQISDIFNATTGFYNMTLPASVIGANLMLFPATRINSSNILLDYGGYGIVTLTYGQTPSQKNITAYPLIGNYGNLTLGFEGQSGASVLNTSLKKFTIQNETGTVVTQAHIEVELEYPASVFPGSNISFSWMGDIGSNDNGSISFPLLNYSVKKIKVYSSQYAPLEKKLTQASLVGGTKYVNLSTFNPKDIEGNEISDLEMNMYISSSECSVPNPPDSCLPGGAMSMAQFNPFSLVIGGGKIDFEIRKTANNITVKYINVNLMASGPPDAMFDESSNSTTSGGNLEEAWRFGSAGPEIYDYIILGVPYDESAIEESEDLRINITNFYDESDFSSSLWVQGINSTDNLTGTDFSDYNTGSYVPYVNGTGVYCNSSDVNLSYGVCYKDTANDMLWFKIPHFSGINPSITGTAKATATVSNNDGTGSGGSAGAVGFTFVPSSTQLSAGFSKELGLNDKLQFYILKTYHFLRISTMTSTSLTINVTSEPQIATLNIGDLRKFDLDGDNYYDLSVKLNSISFSLNKTNLTIQSIHELISASEKEASEDTSAASGESNLIRDNNCWLWIIICVAIVLIIILLIVSGSHKHKKKKRYMMLYGF